MHCAGDFKVRVAPAGTGTAQGGAQTSASQAHNAVLGIDSFLQALELLKEARRPVPPRPTMQC